MLLIEGIGARSQNLEMLRELRLLIMSQSYYRMILKKKYTIKIR